MYCIYCCFKNNCNKKELGASFHKCLSERSSYNKFSGVLIGIRWGGVGGGGALTEDRALIEKSMVKPGSLVLQTGHLLDTGC